MSFLAPPEQGGIPLASAVVARTGEDVVDAGMQVNRDVERSWTALLRVTRRVVFGVANVGYV